ncbi:MAG: hypothetical protein RIS47_144 [Bacteroidota bacterium]|jgi:serine O-acetyltransferase
MQRIDGIFKDVIQQLSDVNNSRWTYQSPTYGQPMPSIDEVKQMVHLCRQVIFPGFYGHSSMTPERMPYYLGVNVDQLFTVLHEQLKRGYCFACERQPNFVCSDCNAEAYASAVNFINSLPELRSQLIGDVEAAFDGDPAAKTHGEVIFCYPAILAITNYRIAHKLLEMGVPLIPRIISELAHSQTGIDIHPGAQIGERFTIDHGTGVVIGETAVIGNNVKLYQGVTLGAKSFPTDENGNPIKGIPRHPFVEDNVVIYSGATILGRITIGKGSVIGGNVWVTNNLPPNSRVVQTTPRETKFTEGAGI